eukprot:Sdes_comp12209_c0_seq1m2957
MSEELQMFLENVGIGSSFHRLVEEGAESMEDLINCTDEDIDVICSACKIKLFQKIKLKTELASYKSQLETPPGISNDVNKFDLDFHDILPSNPPSHHKRRSRGVIPKPLLGDPEKEMAFLECMKENSVNRVNLREVMIKKGLIRKSDPEFDLSDPEVKAAMGKSVIFVGNAMTTPFKQAYYDLVNRASSMLVYYNPGKYNLPQERRAAAESVVRESNYVPYRDIMRKISGRAEGIRRSKVASTETLKAEMEELSHEIDRIHELVSINKERIALCKEHKDFKLGFKIAGENSHLEEELSNKAKQLSATRCQLRKRAWYERNKQAPSSTSSTTFPHQAPSSSNHHSNINHPSASHSSSSSPSSPGADIDDSLNDKDSSSLDPFESISPGP